MTSRLLLRSCAPLFLLVALGPSSPAATTVTVRSLHKPADVKASATPDQPVTTTTDPKPLAGVAEPIPPMLRAPAPPTEPTTPPARIFRDSQYGVSFRVPAAWDLTRKDSAVSTFNLDARSAVRTTKMRAVATITFNPHPTSTFSGALFYFSVTPHATQQQCNDQASAQDPRRTTTTTEIGGLPFTHGSDEHGVICTEARDEIYTARHNNACYRFDLVINTYCGGDVSGVRDISAGELDSVRNRMQAILDSVHFDTN